MKPFTLIQNIMHFFTVFLLAFSLNVSANKSYDQTITNHGGNKKNPDNLIQAMTFMGTRPFYSVDGSFLLDGLFGGNGANFLKNILGLSDQEIESRRSSAIEFFSHRFGINVNDPRVYFTGFQVNPAADFRVIMMTGKENDQGKGYPIIQGGFLVVVLDPSGIDLGGEFVGTHVPAGTLFAEGDYVIKRGQHREDILINYQSRGPAIRVGTGTVVNLEVFHPEWGKGLAWGYLEIHNLPNGQISAQGRNVLTFPGLGIEETLLEQ